MRCFVIRAYIILIVHVFSRRMATRDVWIPEFLVRIYCFASLITSMYVKNLQSF